MQACGYLVAGAALSNAAFYICVAGAAFCDVSKVLLPWIALSGLRKHDTVAKVVAGAAFCDCLENLRKPRKKSYFWSFVKIAL